MAAKPFNRAAGHLQVMLHVITGSPGTGKHTIAGIVGERLGMPVVDIAAVAAGAGLLEPEGVDTAPLAGLVAGVEGPALVVGHLAPQVVRPDLLGMAAVLRRSPYELERVYLERGYPRAKSLENLGAEILDIVAAEAGAAFGGRAVQVDVTGGSIRESAGRVLRALAGSYPSDLVDWLGEVHDRGDARRFFEFIR